jgi:hypothetical protein
MTLTLAEGSAWTPGEVETLHNSIAGLSAQLLDLQGRAATIEQWVWLIAFAVLFGMGWALLGEWWGRSGVTRMNRGGV